MNSYYGLRFSLLGIVYASIGVLVTSLYQVVSPAWIIFQVLHFSIHTASFVYKYHSKPKVNYILGVENFGGKIF